MIDGLQLAPDEWLFASWRPRTILPRPEARQFSRAVAEQSLRRVARLWKTRLAWNESGITAAIGREEALFWLHATFTLHRYGKTEPEKLKEHANAWNLAEVPDRETTLRLLEGMLNAPSMLVILDRLYGWPAVLEQVQRARHSGLDAVEYDDTFRRGLLPYLTEPELEPLREIVRTRMAHPKCPGLVLVLAGLIGVPDAVAAWLPRAMRGEALERAAFFGLGSAAELIARRDWLKRVFTETDVVAWLAHTDLDQLEWLFEGVAGLTASTAVPLARALASRISAAEAAPHFLLLMEQNRGAKPALEWLLADPERTLHGLDGHKWNRKTKLGRQMCEAEEALRRRLNAPLASTTEPVNDLPEDLNRELEQARVLRVKLPVWLGVESLPEVVLGNSSTICAALSTISVDPLEDHPLAVSLRRHGDPATLDSFAVCLFERWLHAGMPAKDRWALGVVGLLGGEQCAATIIPHLRRWPGASRFTIAKLGYDGLLWALRRIGDCPEILWTLRQIGEGSRTALEFFKRLAAERGKSQEQLEDLILPKPPTCAFDYGSRQFEVRIGVDGLPIFLESNGVRHSKPPKPQRADDAPKAEDAWQRLKIIDKELQQLRKFVLNRIEDALLSGACWSNHDFEEVVLRHPIYAPLCQLVVWSCLNTENQVLGTFRVAEDGRYAGPDDQPFELPAETCSIGIPRPSSLCNAEGGKWRQLFDDYNLIPLFAQLTFERPDLTEKGLPADSLDRPEIVLSARCSLVALQQALRFSGYLPGNGQGWSKSYASRIEATFVSEALDSGHVVSLLSFRHREGSLLTARDIDPVIIKNILSDVSQMHLEFETNS
jgi:hypothetical protein